MKTTVEPLEGNRVKLSVTVEESEFDKAVDAALRKISREVRLPGFRPGKAPRKLLEARMGKAGVRQEALREALPDYYAQALKETDVDAIAPPEIDITAGEEAGDIEFAAVVEVRPQVAIAGYQGLRIEIPRVGVTDEELQRQIDRLRQPFGELREVERPAQDKDQVTIDIKGTQDGESVDALTADDFLYEVGSGTIVPEIDDNLRGAKAGDVLEFDAEIGDETASFEVQVKNVKEMVLPDVTDEWAEEASEFATVDELTSDIRSRLENVKKVQASLAIRDKVLEALAELVTDEVPEALVGQEVERRLHDLAHRLQAQGATIEQYLAATGQGGEELVEQMKGAAAEAVKADLALRAVAEAEGIEATDTDIDEEFDKLAGRIDRPVEQVRRELEESDSMSAVRTDIRKAKALQWLMDNVEIVDEDGTPVSRDDLKVDLPDSGDQTDEGDEE